MNSHTFIALLLLLLFYGFRVLGNLFPCKFYRLGRDHRLQKLIRAHVAWASLSFLKSAAHQLLLSGHAALSNANEAGWIEQQQQPLWKGALLHQMAKLVAKLSLAMAISTAESKAAAQKRHVQRQSPQRNDYAATASRGMRLEN
eukprot:4548209-Amphidinium_carterae.1